MSAEQDRELALSQAPVPARAVFLSYASEDAAAAERIAVALRSAGIQVWFDREELRGGDTWDRQIRQQIHDCRLFIAMVSAHTETRDEGYFRREWRLAVERAGDMAEGKPFLVPVVIDDTKERGAAVPDKFRELQWTRLPGGDTSQAFVDRIRRLLTPEGRPVAANATTIRPIPVSSVDGLRLSKALGLGAGAIAAVAVAYFVGTSWLSKHAAASFTQKATVTPEPAYRGIPEKSIAVLPFVDMSEKHDQEYFGDGMAEEVLNVLAKIPDLKVIGRTSSFSFKGKTDDLRSIGQTLGAAYLVEGSVRRSGDHIRVTAQLIDSRNGTHRWSETYDRRAGDAVEVQDEIAASLVRALQLELVPAGLLESRSSTSRGEPYDLYLRGQHALSRFDQPGIEGAIAYFRHALELSPTFAAAAEALAEALEGLVNNDYVAADAGWEETRKAAEQALRLNPRSARAHAILGEALLVHDWNWTGAERELATARSLAPHDPFVLTHAAQQRLAIARLDEAAHLIEAAGAADPLDPDVLMIKTWVYGRQGRLADARDAGHRALEISPTASWQHFYLGVVFLDGGDAASALSEMEKEVHAGARIVGLADAYWALGRRQQANAALSQAELMGADDMPIEIAEAYALRGDAAKAFEWLDRAYAKKDSDLYYVKGDPLLKNLERDPRYKAFLRKMNLPE